MTVYVDPSAFPFHGLLFCHMATDGDLEELHRMAARLGLRRAWFQDKPGHPHYDLSPHLRALAVRCGAVEVSSIELIRICFKKG